MTTIYTLMKKGNVTDSVGNEYPDVLTTNLNNFKFNNSSSYYSLNFRDKQRFDLLMYRLYSKPFYDDIVLWLNNVYKNDLEIGDTLILPNSEDLANFIRRNKKRGEE